MRPRDEKIKNQKINYLVEQKFGNAKSTKIPTLKTEFASTKKVETKTFNVPEVFSNTSNKKTSVKIQQDIKIEDVVNILLSRKQDKKKYTIQELDEIIEKDIIASITQKLKDENIEVSTGKIYPFENLQITTILGEALVTITENELIVTITEELV